MIKIFLDEPLFPHTVLKVYGDNAHHLKVLRVFPGKRIIVGGIDGEEYFARIVERRKEWMSIEIENLSPPIRKPARKVTLLSALPKNNRFEDIVFHCTQIGVFEFIPLITERTEKKINNPNRFFERCQKKARHGSEIAGRSEIPHIRPVISYLDALEYYKSNDYDTGILFWEEENKESHILPEDYTDTLAVFIGPEGGLTKKEALEGIDAGLKSRSMGPLVMDVGTACISASALFLCGEY
ncbi:MAG: 16S rRNA (uracil(1498)-N(3))-methyltransferase [Elusimicrobia bacterium]|nr:16S rRNA (uracil(1498)-N(3))-methyltransferase [Elusimicrobiota bacterium]